MSNFLHTADDFRDLWNDILLIDQNELFKCIALIIAQLFFESKIDLLHI